MINDFGNIGKVPPQAVEIEEIILGAILIEPDVYDRIVIQPEWFYKEPHALIFAAIQEMKQSNKALDIVTLTIHMRDKGDLDLVGGAYYISTLTNKVTHAANISEWVGIIFQKYIYREIIRIGSESSRKAFDSDEDTIDDFLSLTTELSTKLFKEGSETVESVVKQIDEFEGSTSGFLTGYKEMDDILEGIKKQNIYVIAGRPGSGKSSLTISVIWKPMIEYGVKTAVWSLEMSYSQFIMWYYQANDLDKDEIYKKVLTPNKQARYDKAKNVLLNSNPAFIQENSFENFINKLKVLKKEGLDYVFIDYLTLMPVATKYNNGNDKLESVMRDLKNIAKELDIGIVLLSQLNREVEKRMNKRPQLSDLRNSGAIEQSSDVVLFLYRAEYYDKEAYIDEIGEPATGIMEVIVAKNKDGGTGKFFLKYNGNLKIFQDYNPSNENDWGVDPEKIDNNNDIKPNDAF